MRGSLAHSSFRPACYLFPQLQAAMSVQTLAEALLPCVSPAALLLAQQRPGTTGWEQHRDAFRLTPCSCTCLIAKLRPRTLLCGMRVRSARVAHLCELRAWCRQRVADRAFHEPRELAVLQSAHCAVLVVVVASGVLEALAGTQESSAAQPGHLRHDACAPSNNTKLMPNLLLDSVG